MLSLISALFGFFPCPLNVFQYLSRRLGLDSVTFGYLQTTFGVLQLLGGPLFGRYGGKGDCVPLDP